MSRRTGVHLSCGPNEYFVYILECSDGSFYVGSTNDLAARLETHQSGKGPAYIAKRLPVRLAHAVGTLRLAP